MPGVRVTLQSGLPLHWSAKGPVAPEMTRSRAFSLVVKRLADVFLSLAAIVVLLPLLAGTAIAIKLSSRGPVLFRQTRIGLDGCPFQLLKFRTMYAEFTDDAGIQQAIRDDERVTPLGRFLRRTSIDELPQLLNVLLGDMAIIGPRPHVEGMLAAGTDYRDVVPYYDLRCLMRPGISGWAQANGLRGPTNDAIMARSRVNHDIAYLQNFSLWLDVRIILMTLKREFLTGSGV